MFFGCCVRDDAQTDSAQLPEAVKLEAVSHSNAEDERTWDVHLEKAEKGPLGLELNIDNEKRLAVLSEPKFGPASAVNERAKNKGFRPGDVVAAVNGVTGEARALLTRIRECIRGSDPLTLTMKRLVDYTITIDVVGGLGLAVVDSGGIAKVEAIKSGCDVDVYNKGCLAGYRVAQGDWVVSVDGMLGAPRNLIPMLNELRPGSVTLRLGRPAPFDNPGSRRWR